MTEKPVLAAHKWNTNADLIVDLVRMKYLRKEWLTLDPTFGDGNWWTHWQPDVLVKHDLYKLDDVDFRALPHPDSTFDVCVYDPPYVVPGGRETSTIKEMHDAYGMDGDFKNPAELQELINAGLREMWRVVKRPIRAKQRGGLVLVKCANYVWSGRLNLGAHDTLNYALGLGFKVEDWFTHVGGVRPQPGGRTHKCGRCKASGVVADYEGSAIECPACGGDGRIPTEQQHARQNASTLYVLRRGWDPKPEKQQAGLFAA